MTRCLFRTLLLLLVGVASAQETPIVTVEVTPAEILVGESAQLRVTVLVPTWFPSPPVFPSFELSNAITRLPPDSSFPTSQRVGRDTWSGIVRNYRVYPLLGATYRLAGQSITVSYADPGSDPIRMDVEIPEIGFRGVVPAGAESLDPYIAGHDLTLRREIEGDMDELEAGDAIVVRYIAELDGLPALFIPPLTPEISAPGITVYAKEPVVEDGQPGRRIEAATLVFDAGGNFEIPATSLSWWNTGQQRVEQSSVAATTITVAGPGPAETISGPESHSNASQLWTATATIAGLAILISLGRYALQHRRTRITAYMLTEAYAFEQTRKTFKRGDPQRSYCALLDWISRLDSGLNATQFIQRFGSVELQEQFGKLIRNLYGGETQSVDLNRIQAELVNARRIHMAETGVSRRSPALPTLNP